MHGPPESQREPHGRVSGASVGNHGAELCYGNRWLNPRTVCPRKPRAPGERRLGALFSAFCSRNFSFFFFFYFFYRRPSPRQRKLCGSARVVSEKRDTLAPECRMLVAAHNTTLHTRPAKPFREGYLPQYPAGEKGEGCEARKGIKEKKKNIGDRLRGGCDGQFFWHLFETKRVVGRVSPETLGGSLAC